MIVKVQIVGNLILINTAIKLVVGIYKFKFTASFTHIIPENFYYDACVLCIIFFFYVFETI